MIAFFVKNWVEFYKISVYLFLHQDDKWLTEIENNELKKEIINESCKA